jgi:hypothetical protein
MNKKLIFQTLEKIGFFSNMIKMNKINKINKTILEVM